MAHASKQVVHHLIGGAIQETPPETDYFNIVFELVKTFQRVFPRPLRSAAHTVNDVVKNAALASEAVTRTTRPLSVFNSDPIPDIPSWMYCYTNKPCERGVCTVPELEESMKQRAQLLSAITVFCGVPECADDARLTHLDARFREYVHVNRLHILACDSCDFTTFQAFATLFCLHGAGDIIGSRTIHEMPDCPQYKALPYAWQRRHWIAAEMWLSRLRMNRLTQTMQVQMLYGLTGRRTKLATGVPDTFSVDWTDVPTYLVEQRLVHPKKGVCTLETVKYLDATLNHIVRKRYSTVSWNWLHHLSGREREFVQSQVYDACRAGILTGSRRVFDLLQDAPHISMKTSMHGIRSVIMNNGQHPFLAIDERRLWHSDNAIRAVSTIACDLQSDTDKVEELLRLLMATAPPCVTRLIGHIQSGRNGLKHYGRRQLVLFLKGLHTPDMLLFNVVRHGCRFATRATQQANENETTMWSRDASDKELSCATLIRNEHQQSFCPFHKARAAMSGGDETRTGALVATDALRHDLQNSGYEGHIVDVEDTALCNSFRKGESGCTDACRKLAERKHGRVFRDIRHPTDLMAQICKRPVNSDSDD